MSVEIKGRIDVNKIVQKRVHAKQQELEHGMSDFLANMNRRLDRGLDWKGKKFKRYSKSHAKVRKELGLTTSKVNLRFGKRRTGSGWTTSPSMRDSLQQLKPDISRGRYTAKIGFSGTDPKAAEKARGHEEKHGRKWFAMSDKILKNIKQRIDRK